MCKFHFVWYLYVTTPKFLCKTTLIELLNYTPSLSNWLKMKILKSFIDNISSFFSSKGKKNESAAFSVGLVILGAKLAKADGKVTRDEIAAFKQVFEIPKGEEASVARLFDNSRRSADGFQPYAKQIAKMFSGRTEVLENLLGCLFHIAHADGKVTEGELNYLYEVSKIFGLSEEAFNKLGPDACPPFEDNPYSILGVTPDDDPAAVKLAYRKLVKSYHPDKLITEGASEEDFARANQKLAEINAAYEAISRTRRVSAA
jgi:DnaJ like chaperone protein